MRTIAHQDTSTPDDSVSAEPPEAHGSERPPWSVIFVLSTSLSAKAYSDIRATLDRPAAAICDDKEPALSVRANGSMDDALADAVAAVSPALARLDEEVEVREVEVREVHMIPHADAARQLAERRPLKYYGVTESARSLGISRQRVRQLVIDDKMLAPHAEVSGKPAWDADILDAYAAMRDVLLRATPPGRTPKIPDLRLVMPLAESDSRDSLDEQHP
jgi:hypothetical protein